MRLTTLNFFFLQKVILGEFIRGSRCDWLTFMNQIQTWIRWERFFVNLATNKDDAKREIAHENALCEKYGLWIRICHRYGIISLSLSMRYAATEPLRRLLSSYACARTQPHRISHTSIFNDITLRIVTHIVWIRNCQRLLKVHGVSLREKKAAAITKKIHFQAHATSTLSECDLSN